MIGRLDLSLIFIFGLDMLVTASNKCVMDIGSCTRQMTHDFNYVNNRTLVCGIMKIFLNCVECSCNISLTQCDLHKTKFVISNLLKDFGIPCELYIPRNDVYCSASIATRSTSSMFVLYLPLCVWILMKLWRR